MINKNNNSNLENMPINTAHFRPQEIPPPEDHEVSGVSPAQISLISQIEDKFNENEMNEVIDEHQQIVVPPEQPSLADAILQRMNNIEQENTYDELDFPIIKTNGPVAIDQPKTPSLPLSRKSSVPSIKNMPSPQKEVQKEVHI